MRICCAQLQRDAAPGEQARERSIPIRQKPQAEPGRTRLRGALEPAQNPCVVDQASHLGTLDDASAPEQLDQIIHGLPEHLRTNEFAHGERLRAHFAARVRCLAKKQHQALERGDFSRDSAQPGHGHRMSQYARVGSMPLRGVLEDELETISKPNCRQTANLLDLQAEVHSAMKKFQGAYNNRKTIG